MKKFLFFLCLFAVSGARAQYSARLIVNAVATRAQDDIYVMGNFNNWNPKDENYKLKPFGGSRKSITIKNIAAGTYAFKFSRGGTDKIETTADGRDISDRVLEVNDDVSQEITIAGWKDDYPDKPKAYTASPQVRIVDTAFKIPQLNTARRIWVYLPKGYATSPKTYPVLYMQDGQNLFNEKTAAGDEWGVDECLDTLQQKLGKECIVVAIDNGGAQREAEYSPYAVAGKEAKGKQYAEFLVTTLKPYIDGKYRTRKTAENNFVAGSGLGALISLYTAMQYPAVFGGAGVFSPVFNAPEIYTQAESFNTAIIPRFYLYAGVKESGTTVADLQKMAAILQKKQQYNIRTVVYPLGQYKETYWRQEFRDFYQWLLQ